MTQNALLLIKRCLGLVLLAAFLTTSYTQAQAIPTPEQFFGFQMGADRKLAHWNELVKYYNQLGEASPRMKVVNMGKTTLGNPFLALYISSPENLAKLDEYKAMNAKLSDPRGVSPSEIDQIIATGKAVVVQSFGLHSSEVAASQTAAEFTYDMLTRTDTEMMTILDNVISIVIPCFNPDGEIMITEWYRKYVGTEYEGNSMPYLYHHYIGHDNNRDAYMQNTIESVYGADIIFRQWMPQAYVDHHQMGAYGARIYVPPYAEPIRPDGDPLVWREMSWYGAHIAYKEEENNKSGVVNAAIYSGWGHFGFHWITPFHNIAGMLTESASARLATPLFVHPDQLEGSIHGMPKYEAQTSFPNPWPGGWWRVRDIVEQQKIAALAIADIAGRNRETVLKNAYLKASRQTQRGAEGEVKAYIIPAEQHDALTANKLVNVLLGQGVEVKRIDSQLIHEGKVYGAGSYVVSMAQPKQGVVRWLLGRTFYPDNEYTRDRNNDPIRPYDMSTDNVAEYMGVRVDPVQTALTGNYPKVTEKVAPKGTVYKGSKGYVLSGAHNDSFTALNLLWDNKVKVSRVTKAGSGLQPGDFVVTSVAADVASSISAQTGVDFKPLEADVTAISQPMTRQRIALFQRYMGGNMDEGWTRLLLENFKFPYTTLMDKEILAGELNKKYDVIVLPDDAMSAMTGEGGGGRNRAEDFPPEYRSGFGQKGVDALKAFVENGGTLITFGSAGDLPIEKFKLPIRNVVKDVASQEFWSPGSTLRMNFDNSNPLAYGMPDSGYGLFVGNNDVYEVVRSDVGHTIDRIITYPKRDILQSGWLLGEDVIAEKAAMVSVGLGRGKVVMIGFRPQLRVQTHGTFKLVFNSLVLSK
ncbi:M14 metallopeptidase family protein [uncultured Imperialibacter sp.]|uniref:M14 family metallopeptidase n=1 Tax=uncultured Imperialibacter sp. TaxID=1672639 RepID=UPI0030DC880D|tara:strand:+ start:64416 stop:67007 length:2592 start_codon:yes stop_codon:yes gene_type:complete